MKCKVCKKRMIDIRVDLECEHSGMMKKAINVPACQCRSCGNALIPDLVLSKLDAYAEWVKSNVIDYAKCEQNEAEIFAVLHTFNNL